jgi:hypothetical protein
MAPHSAVFYFAVGHLLLFSSICPVSSRIYETNDAVIIEGSTIQFSIIYY